MPRRKRISPKTICGMIFGHIHNNTNAAYWPLIRASLQMLNAGVDVNDFQPVTLEEWLPLMTWGKYIVTVTKAPQQCDARV